MRRRQPPAPAGTRPHRRCAPRLGPVRGRRDRRGRVGGGGPAWRVPRRARRGGRQAGRHDEAQDRHRDVPDCHEHHVDAAPGAVPGRLRPRARPLFVREPQPHQLREAGVLRELPLLRQARLRDAHPAGRPRRDRSRRGAALLVRGARTAPRGRRRRVVLVIVRDLRARAFDVVLLPAILRVRRLRGRLRRRHLHPADRSDDRVHVEQLEAGVDALSSTPSASRWASPSRSGGCARA